MTEPATYAWIFLSVSSKPTPLREVIAMADGLNRAIPTLQELQVSLGWLQSHGLILKKDAAYSLTNAGVELREGVSAKSGGKRWDAVSTRFSKLIGTTAPLDDISESQVDEAYAAYVGRVRSAK